MPRAKIRVYKSEWQDVVRPWRYNCTQCLQRGYFWRWKDAYRAAWQHVARHALVIRFKSDIEDL